MKKVIVIVFVLQHQIVRLNYFCVAETTGLDDTTDSPTLTQLLTAVVPVNYFVNYS